MIKEIDFVFENGELITIDGKDIGVVDISMLFNIPLKKSKTFYCSVLKNANIWRYPFGDERFLSYKIFDRFCRNDITGFIIKRDKSDDFVFDVNYEDASDELGASNLNQKTVITRDGNLHMYITLM